MGVSSLGSKVTVGGATLHCTVTMTDNQVRDVDNTNSSCAASNYDAVVADNFAQFDVPWDPTNMPDIDVGLIPGNKVTVVIYDGATGSTVTLTGALVKNHQRIRRNGEDIIRSIVNLKGGVLTQS